MGFFPTQIFLKPLIQYCIVFSAVHCCPNRIKTTHSFLTPEIRGVLVFEIWTKRGVMKKLLRNRGLVERGGGGGGPICLIVFD